MIRRLDLPDTGAFDAEGRPSAPSALRNLAPIQTALAMHFPSEGRVLELASGFGDHIVSHARCFPELTWRPSELDPERLSHLAVRVKEEGAPNLMAPLFLDACASGWGAAQGPCAAVLVVNLLHLISEAEVAVLIDEATQALAPTGMCAIYGPFLREGEATSSGDAAFDASLRAQDPAIGYKDLGAIASVLEAMQLRVVVEPMPANNVMIFAKRVF